MITPFHFLIKFYITTMSEIKLNIGCGGRPLSGYINIDMDTADQLRKRYPTHTFPPDFQSYQYNIFNLPYKNNTVDEVRADALVEHMSFIEEPKFFREMHRVLRPGGAFRFSTPDFEETIKDWLKAKDDWKEFFRNDDEAIAKQHWFGNYSYARDNRWGYLTAMIFGSQNSEGQFHKNCYTEGKVRAMLAYLKFSDIKVDRERWQGDRDMMLLVECRKS